MKKQTSICPVSFIAAIFVLQAAWAPAASPRPNVVLVITDDQGYGDLACHGNTMIRTPNLDRLHGESIRLTNFHVDPTCSPTRAALLTGRYSTRAGVWHTVMGRSILFRDEVTLADLFGAAGYRCGIFGKWHLGDNYPSRPQDRGFHETVIHGGGGIGQTPDFWGNDYFDPMLLHDGKWKRNSGYCTDIFFDHALRFIEKNKRRPFFLYLPTNVPHSPFRVADRYSQFYSDKGVPQPMANFYGMIENFDENLGRLRTRLKELGLEENTIFIFMTDNGTAAGAARQPPAQSRRPNTSSAADSDWKGFNAGMRAQKGTEYDGGHRVPFFIRWPAGPWRGVRDVPQLTAHFDVLPTLAELCHLKLPRDRPLDGRSLVPLLRGETSAWPDRTLFVHVQREEIPPKWNRSAVLTERWRLVNGAELYDVRNDPGQSRNIAAEHPNVVSELREAYDLWWTGLEPSFDKHGWIVLGSRRENPSRLNLMDWHFPADHAPVSQSSQAAVEKSPWVNGYWMVELERAGRYEFTLRERPAAAAHPIDATQARVRIGDTETSSPIRPGVASVSLTLKLDPGRFQLQTWLINEATGQSRGAFYVDVRRL